MTNLCTITLFFQGKLWQNTYYWKIRTCEVMLWTRYYLGTWIVFQDLLKNPHFFLWLSFWQKKLHCKIQAFFVISFFCYFVTPLFTYWTQLCLGENITAPNLLCGLAGWRILQAGILAELWAWFTVNGLISHEVLYCCVCVQESYIWVTLSCLQLCFCPLICCS